MIYHCFNCDCIFAEPIIRIERHGNEGPWGERLLCCPRCRIPQMLEEVESDEIT